jgi:hypothetical protein
LPDLDSTILTSPNGFVMSSPASVTVRYNFLTAEPTDGSGNPDKFSIDVLAGSAVNVSQGLVNSGLTPIASGPVVAPDGSTFVYESGWKTTTLSLSPLVGQTVTLRLLVADTADNAFDSGLIIDSVDLVGVSMVPEPATWTLMLLGALYLTPRCFRRRSGRA